MKNYDPHVIEDFGREWATFDQGALGELDLERAFEQYFDIFPFDALGPDASGFDMGCGSGRWAALVARRVGSLICVDPSPQALNVARQKLATYGNVSFDCAAVDSTTITPGSQDFGYSLGVLHHIPNTGAGIQSCANLLKRGAPFLLYLYYDFENRPFLFRIIWRLSDVLRRLISRLPFRPKLAVTSAIALFVYLPLARMALVLEKLGSSVEHFPLSDYRLKPFYFMKTDALDRFGTRLEKRYSRSAIKAMLEDAGFERVTFSHHTPYWVSLAYKR